ncbi:MAG: lmo0937 family membrane protein [bacterium]|nr:lmo0937 family membrane protein [bacterium]
MLVTIAVVLIVLWLLGLITSYTVSGFIHILLVAAVILVIVRLVQGKKVV